MLACEPALFSRVDFFTSHPYPGCNEDPSQPCALEGLTGYRAEQAAASGRPVKESKLGEALYEVITGQSIMLMAGLLVIGFIATIFMPEKGMEPFLEFFKSKGMLFRGVLCIFLLEMGLVAGEKLGDLLKVGPFLVAFGILMPLIHGFVGVYLGHLAGLNLGGCTVFGAIVSSASYIAAPPAVRLTLPEANPTLSITAALAITFPFNIAFGIPIYFEMAKWVGARPGDVLEITGGCESSVENKHYRFCMADVVNG
jgi:hypothetical protein